MKIKNEESPLFFSELNVGDTFSIGQSSYIYLKCGRGPLRIEDYKNFLNSVCLSTNEFTFISEKTQVRRVFAQLVMEK